MITDELTPSQLSNRVRREIKKRIEEGLLPDGKYTIRVKNFSNSPYLEVTIKNIPGMDPMSEKVEETRKEVEKILEAHSHAKSGSFLDRISTPFFGRCDIDFGWRNEWKNRA